MAYLTWNCVVIPECYKYTAKEVREMIDELRETNPGHEGLAKRSDNSYLREWATHALCFKLGIEKERAKNADLQYDLKRKHALFYSIVGPFALLILGIFC